MSKVFNVFVLDAQRNTFIIARDGYVARKRLKKSLVISLLSLVPLALNRVLALFRLPKEEVGRISYIFDLGILLDAIRIGSKVKPSLLLVEEFYSLAALALIMKKILGCKALILDLHNIDTFRLMRYPNVNKLFLKLIYLTELVACRISNAVIVVSKFDHHITERLLYSSRVYVTHTGGI